MVKLKKVIAGIAVAAMALSLTACGEKESVKYSVDTGEDIIIEINSSKGFSLEQNENYFAVKDKEDNAVLEGQLVVASDFDLCVDMVKNDENATINEETDSYIYWDYEPEEGDVEHDRMLVISDQTAVLIGSVADKKTGEKAFAAMNFSSKPTEKTADEETDAVKESVTEEETKETENTTIEEKETEKTEETEETEEEKTTESAEEK